MENYLEELKNKLKIAENTKSEVKENIEKLEKEIEETKKDIEKYFCGVLHDILPLTFMCKLMKIFCYTHYLTTLSNSERHFKEQLVAMKKALELLMKHDIPQKLALAEEKIKEFNVEDELIENVEDSINRYDFRIDEDDDFYSLLYHRGF